MTEPHEHCEICGKRIYKETDQYEQDECFEIDGYKMCIDCVMPYLQKYHYIHLRA